MCAKHLLAALSLALILTTAVPAVALDAKGLARLKKAGVEDATIALMVQERTTETGAFTIEDILAMKSAGIGEAALRTFIREGSFMKERGPVVYGSELRSVRLGSVDDILRLKQAGVSDEVLQAVVKASRRGADVDQEQALRQLQEMGIWVEPPR